MSRICCQEIEPSLGLSPLHAPRSAKLIPFFGLRCNSLEEFSKDL
jgi:hypothetical protein